MERNRTVISQVCVLSRRWPAPQERAHGVDDHSVRAEDRHRLERPAHRGLRLLLQDLPATTPRVVPAGLMATDAPTAVGQVARRRPTRLVESAGRLQSGESPAGGTKTGPNPTDRGRSGSKHCLLTDAHGVPLVIQTVPANQHDSTTLLPLVVEIPAVAGKRGRPKQKPATLMADKAFDDQALRGLLRWLGIQPYIPKRRTDERGLGK